VVPLGLFTSELGTIGKLNKMKPKRRSGVNRLEYSPFSAIVLGLVVEVNVSWVGTVLSLVMTMLNVVRLAVIPAVNAWPDPLLSPSMNILWPLPDGVE
jgi:hypothetical protein